MCKNFVKQITLFDENSHCQVLKKIILRFPKDKKVFFLIDIFLIIRMPEFGRIEILVIT